MFGNKKNCIDNYSITELRQILASRERSWDTMVIELGSHRSNMTFKLHVTPTALPAQMDREDVFDLLNGVPDDKIEVKVRFK